MADTYLRCTVCGRKSTTSFASSLQKGWEKCCGYTMRLMRTEADVEKAVGQIAGPGASFAGVLYVNDTPARRCNGGVDGGYVYDADKQHVVAVTYVTPDHDCVRVSFDPRTGEPSIQRYREDGGPASPRTQQREET